MKAYIDQKGRMTVRAETPLEGYALNKWLDDNLGGSTALRTDNLIFVTLPPATPPSADDVQKFTTK